MAYWEPDARTLPLRVDDLRLLATFLTVTECTGVKGRMTHYYRHGTVTPACKIEKENLALILHLKWKKYVNKADAQAELDVLREQRRLAQEEFDRNHVWTFKKSPFLPVSPEFSPNSTDDFLHPPSSPRFSVPWGGRSIAQGDWTSVMAESESSSSP